MLLVTLAAAAIRRDLPKDVLGPGPTVLLAGTMDAGFQYLN